MTADNAHSNHAADDGRSVPANDPAVFDRFARFYDDDYRDYDDDLAMILELAEAAQGPVVELGCGTGRVMSALSANGYPVTGIDVSPALLDVARRKLAAPGHPGKTTLVRADLRAPKVHENAFALAVCTSNTLMHFTTPDDQLAVLRSAFRLLRSGGLLFLDLFNPDIARLLEVNGLMELADRWTNDERGGEVLKWSVRSVDLAEQLQETTFIYEENLPTGEMRRTVCPFTLRYLWRNEGELMLRVAGFEVDDVLGDFLGSPYDSASEHLIFLARKP